MFRMIGSPNWGRFAHLPARPSSPGPRPARRSRELGSFRMFRPPGAQPCPGWAKLGSFCMIAPRPTSLGPHPAPHCRGIGFVCTAVSQPTTGYRLPDTAFWLCFAQLPLVPSGPVAPGVAGNWVRFAHLPGVLQAPSPPAPAANWLCFTELALFCQGQIHGKSTITRSLPSTCPCFRSAGIGFVSHDRPRS